jgi:hypothetical protein
MRGSAAPVAVAAAEGKSAEAPRLWNPGPPARPECTVTRGDDMDTRHCRCQASTGRQKVGVPETGNDWVLSAAEVSTPGAGIRSLLTADSRDGDKVKARSYMTAETKNLVSMGRELVWR